jgi:GAF domain
VLASGQPIELSDVTHDPQFARDVAERTGYVPRSILAMPVEGSQQTLGCWRCSTVAVRMGWAPTKASC